LPASSGAQGVPFPVPQKREVPFLPSKWNAVGLETELAQIRLEATSRFLAGFGGRLDCVTEYNDLKQKFEKTRSEKDLFKLLCVRWLANRLDPKFIIKYGSDTNWPTGFVDRITSLVRRPSIEWARIVTYACFDCYDLMQLDLPQLLPYLTNRFGAEADLQLMRPTLITYSKHPLPQEAAVARRTVPKALAPYGQCYNVLVTESHETMAEAHSRRFTKAELELQLQRAKQMLKVAPPELKKHAAVVINSWETLLRKERERKGNL
jgi:hypothetical protein